MSSEQCNDLNSSIITVVEIINGIKYILVGNAPVPDGFTEATKQLLTSKLSIFLEMVLNGIWKYILPSVMFVWLAHEKGYVTDEQAT